MQKQLRIKLDPRRGGLTALDFIRPCFHIENWTSGDIDLWSSPDGLAWTRLDESGYRATHNTNTKVLRVELLTDLTAATYLAFIDLDGSTIGIGFSYRFNNRCPVGWHIEADRVYMVDIGWAVGSSGVSGIQAGFTVNGLLGSNIPVGFDIKHPVIASFAVGYHAADPVDKLYRIGFSSGILDTVSISIAATILGLSETPASMIWLDPSTLAGMSNEVAVHKQKIVTLTGTSPEELD